MGHRRSGRATGAASPFSMPMAMGCSISSTAIGKDRTGCSFSGRAVDLPMRRRRKWRSRRESRTVIAADFDNDGIEEIFFNNIGQPNRLFAWSHGRWTEVEIGDAEEPHGLGTGAAVADIDGDGRLELLISHGELAPQPLSFYRPYPNDNAWLRVMPLTAAGAPARGAVVDLHGQGTDERRAICAGSGYLVPDGAGGAFRAWGGPFGGAGGGALAGRDGAAPSSTHVNRVLRVEHPAADGSAVRAVRCSAPHIGLDCNYRSDDSTPMEKTLAIAHPYLLFLGDAPDQLAAKTADGVACWRRTVCLGQLRLPGCKADLGLPDMSVEEAAAPGSKTLIVGIANRGGVLAPSWQESRC